ncbi:MAG TPA: alpha/beta hydrolase [Acidobacteriaceae bacterium]|jgi:pimeloyl-ACP methyl ester carboxylesterase|nr:alpha/beta hydrolase [Acidobacteriaceae bacterium]
MRRLFRFVVCVLVPLALAGACYQSFENHIVPKRYPLPGRMVDVGGYRLRILCEGTASPTVVIDGGIGTATMGWTIVQKEVSQFARVCVYDRAGYFASDTIPGPRTSEQMAQELHALLANAGEHGPFVLVGHSFGAFTARVYHQLYPDEVAGIVMVDGSQEDGTATLKSLLPAHRVHMLEAEQRLLLGSEPMAARLGLLRFITEPSGTPSDWKLFPPGMKEQAAAWMWRTPFDDVEAEEFARFDESAEQARRSGTLGDLPLIVITARQPWLGPPVTQEDIPAVLAFQQVWIDDLQMRLVHLSTRGRQVIAEKSNHGIQFLEPEVVVGAVRDVVRQVAASTTKTP